MRTTIVLPNGLAEAAKARATAEGRTFTSVIAEGLRMLLSTEPKQTTGALPAYGDPEGEVLIDLTDREALGEALDADGLR